MSVISQLPAEIHSSAHQVRHDNSLLGEYEMRVYKGVEGPLAIVQASTTSPLPLEYLSERAILKFLEALPVSQARFFERHHPGNTEAPMEIGFSPKGFHELSAPPAISIAAVSRPKSSDQTPVLVEGRTSLSHRR